MKSRRFSGRQIQDQISADEYLKDSECSEYVNVSRAREFHVKSDDQSNADKSEVADADGCDDNDQSEIEDGDVEITSPFLTFNGDMAI